MKLLLFTDNHFVSNSSVINKFGTKFSMRLENQITSLNWLEQVALDKKCDGVICLGDFFDKAFLTDQELTALKEIKWNGLPHYFLVGNHESADADLCWSATKTLENNEKQMFVINRPTTITHENVELCFLPYVIESDRKPISEYFSVKNTPLRVLFSHNDLKGIQLGPVMTRQGFELSDITANCDICINGHLHNGGSVTPTIYNLGNLTGQNFTENAFNYSHSIMILETASDGRYRSELIENPYAFNFYGIEIKDKADLNQLDKIKYNSALSIKCKTDLKETVMAKLETLQDKIVYKRLILIQDSASSSDSSAELTFCNEDHHTKLINWCYERLGKTDTVVQELGEICK